MRKLNRLAAVLVLVLGASRVEAQDRTTSPHGALATECAVCHGPDSWTVLQISGQFDHARLGFPLTGAHGATTCRACHLSLDFRAVSGDCAACHNDDHRGELGPTCARCHTSRSFVDRDLMVRGHQLTRFQLQGSHLAVDCTACHKSTSAGQLQFVGTPTTCVSCHGAEFNAAPNHVASNFPTTCEQCHGAVTWAATGTAAHLTTPIALTGVHSANLILCAQCHTTTPYSAVARTCDGCHHSEYVTAKDPDHAAANFSLTCTNCHGLVVGWAGATFNHPTSPIALTGAHNANLVTCAQCHTTMPYATVQTTCDGCHHNEYLATTNPSHQSAGYGTDCATCHQVVAGWAGATANHPTTPIALTGVHSSTLVQCTECHTTMPYSTVQRTCDGCHHAEFVAPTDPNHVLANFSTTCTACHGLVANWTGAKFLAHDGSVSPFRIYSGKHNNRWSNCSECHAAGQSYAATPALLCLNCHAKVQTDEHRGKNYTPSDCVRSGCHANGSSP